MAVMQLPSGPEVLLIEADFPSTHSQKLFTYWTEPALLQLWWPQKAELEPQLGGTYHFSWLQMNWHLRGCYTTFKSGQQLGFTWRWDHDAQDIGEREVNVVFEPTGNTGTRLLLTHGRYLATSEDQVIRNEHHLTGWEHFIARLQQIAG